MKIQALVSQLFVTCLAVALQVGVMILGWGLHPRSWWWIVGGGVFGWVFLRALADRLERESKPKGA